MQLRQLSVLIFVGEMPILEGLVQQGEIGEHLNHLAALKEAKSQNEHTGNAQEKAP